MTRVIKVARKGFDVKTAGDENLLYSSLWPVLSIFKEVPIKITNPNADTIIFEHGLGYPPMFWDFTNFTNTFNLSGSSQFFSGLFSVNEKYLKYTKPQTAATGPIEGVVQLFTLDLSKQYTAPVVNVGGVSGNIRSTRSFKLAKEGKSIHSTKLKDFVISTDARSPLIHSVNPGVVQSNGGDIYGNGFTVEHTLRYVPLCFGYGKGSDGYYSILASGGGGATRFAATPSKVIFSEAAVGRELTLVLMKDPFEAEQTGVITV